MKPGQPSKPPIGLRPRFIVDLQRFDEICCAMVRYRDVGLTIPEDWETEFNELRHRLKGRLSRFGAQLSPNDQAQEQRTIDV